MTDDRDGPSSGSFSERLAAAQKRRAIGRGDGGRKGGGMPGDMLGMAYRISIELVVPPLVGAFLGWLLDGWLGLRGWCMVILLLLGGAAGVMNVLRTMRKMGSGGPKSGPGA